MVISKKLSLQTRGNCDTHDVTDAVAQAVRESAVKSGTATLFFYTGRHADYHRMSDTVERLDVAGLVDVARMVLRTILALENGDSHHFSSDRAPIRATKGP